MTLSINTLFECITTAQAARKRAEDTLTELKNKRKDMSALDYRIAVADCKTAINLETRRAYRYLNTIAEIFGCQLKSEETDYYNLKISLEYFRRLWNVMQEAALTNGFAV